MIYTDGLLKKIALLTTALFCVGVVSACAAPQNVSDKYDRVDIDSDSLEALNCGIFKFNRTVDGVFLEPIARGYAEIMPERGRAMVSNFVDNIGEPVTFANSLLQLDGENSFCTLWRFMLNSTIGVAGLFDVASEIGLKNRDTGFGDTFAVYGADAGPYLILPILGPSNIRDGLGRIGDVLVDPISYTNNPVFYSIVGVKTLDLRYRNLKLLDDIYKTSLDPYATIRSGYMQHREAEVKKARAAHKKSLNTAKEQGTR